MERAYGHPYFLIHRADLHAILHARALDVGVLFHVNSAVKEVDENGPFVLLRDGHIIRGDVIIGADGIRTTSHSTNRPELIRHRGQIGHSLRCHRQ